MKQKLNYPKQISLSEATDCIDLIYNLNLKIVDIDEIKKLLNPLWSGYNLSAPIIRPGERFYRGVVLESKEEKPKNVKRISYPSPIHVTKEQRANRIGEPRFYCSNLRSTTLAEMSISPGDCVAISRWDLKQPLFAPNIGFTESVFEKHNSKRTVNDIWWNKACDLKVNQVIHEFFSNAFSRKISKGDEYQYKLSIAISEGMFGNPQLIGGFTANIQNPPAERRFGILLYPSFAVNANTDNAVLLPEFVDKYLDLKFVEYVRIEEVDLTGGQLDKTTLLDFANSIDNDETIEWKGRITDWRGSENAIISVKNGEKVVRDINGNLIIRISTEDGQEVARNRMGEVVEPI